MSAKSSTGVMLITLGWIGIFIGLVISVSFVGAICGVPMILVCIPMIIWGHIMKAKAEDVRLDMVNERLLHAQAVAEDLNICPRCKTPNKNTSPFCSGCGFSFVPIKETHG